MKIVALSFNYEKRKVLTCTIAAQTELPKPTINSITKKVKKRKKRYKNYSKALRKIKIYSSQLELNRIMHSRITQGSCNYLLKSHWERRSNCEEQCFILCIKTVNISHQFYEPSVFESIKKNKINLLYILFHNASFPFMILLFLKGDNKIAQFWLNEEYAN